MQYYEIPALEIIELEGADIISTSGRAYDADHYQGDEETLIGLF